MSEDDRHSIADVAPVLTDEDEIAHREAEYGLKQFSLAVEIIRNHVKDDERPFKLRSSIILKLHSAALEGLHSLAGTYRNTPVKLVEANTSRQNPQWWQRRSNIFAIM